MRNIKLIIEYDGTNYFGWQKQNNALGIQEVVEKAINKITNEEVELIGASRTDAGVHARGFVANFITSSGVPADKFKDAINTKLPSDIVILNSEEVNIEFHSRYHSLGKTYIYSILNRKDPNAIGRNYMHHFKYDLNMKDMSRACEYFIGTHDFESFKNKGSSVKTSVRTISELNISRNNDIIEVRVTADGFLYNMVRIIVGTLLGVGVGKIKPEAIRDIIQSKDRTSAGKSAPAKGLCLKQVYYQQVIQ